MQRLLMMVRYLMLVPLFLGACARNDPAKDAYFAENLNCPPPAIGEFDPWGQSGSEHVCKIRHGPFVAFEAGHVNIRGQYDNGEKVGVWRWYGADGKVEKEIDYSKKQ